MDQRSTDSDAALLERVRSGETECFAELVRRYQPALTRVARSRLGRADWAEDVVQETFLAAFKSCASYDPRYNFRTWLWTILLNQCRGHYQRRLRHVPCEPTGCNDAGALDHAAEEPGESPLASLLAKERAARLELLLNRLSSVQADALRLRFFGGLKFHEIAAAMECSLNTAKARVRCGLERMAQMIEAAGATGPASGDEREET
ncbi:MAG: RNA polymerase sigma factor [Pirellulales bacterium]